MAENVGLKVHEGAPRQIIQRIDNLGASVTTTQTLVVHPIPVAQFDRCSITYTNGDANTITMKVWIYNYKNVDPISITSITKADPGVITTAAHGIGSGYEAMCWITGARGMTELLDDYYILTYASGTTLSLKTKTGVAIDTSSYSDYIADSAELIIGPLLRTSGAPIRKADGWAQMSNQDTDIATSETEAVWFEGEWDILAITAEDDTGSVSSQDIRVTLKRTY